MIKEIDGGGGTSILIRFSENSTFLMGWWCESQRKNIILETLDLRKKWKTNNVRFIAEQQLLSYRFYAW